MQQAQPLIAALQTLETDRAWLHVLCDLAALSGAGLVDREGRWISTYGSPYSPFIDPAMLTPSGQTLHEGEHLTLITVPFLTAYAVEKLWCVAWVNGPISEIEAYRRLAQITEHAARQSLLNHRVAADHHAEVIERAAATAKIGVWSCALPSQELSWSDGVYDLFDLPRRTVVTRDRIVAMYEHDSAVELERLRSHAIATLGSFTMEASIKTGKGNKRIIRITAAVDSVDGRPTQLIGVKQDITAERALAEQTRHLAETDSLTGLANRSKCQSWLNDLAGEKSGRAIGALLIIDLDKFKSINDTLGHLAGDACLVEAAKRLQACAPETALVARLGGDEFAILTDARHPLPPNLPETIIRAFDRPFLLGYHTQQIGISVGLAMRTQTDTPDTLYHSADMALYEAKSAGRGTWRRSSAA